MNSFHTPVFEKKRKEKGRKKQNVSCVAQRGPGASRRHSRRRRINDERDVLPIGIDGEAQPRVFDAQRRREHGVALERERQDDVDEQVGLAGPHGRLNEASYERHDAAIVLECSIGNGVVASSSGLRRITGSSPVPSLQLQAPLKIGNTALSPGFGQNVITVISNSIQRQAAKSF